MEQMGPVSKIQSGLKGDYNYAIHIKVWDLR